MEPLKFVYGELEAIHKRFPHLPEMWPLLAWLAGLRPEKITPGNAGFINEISEIMSGVLQSKQKLPQACAVWGACGAAAGAVLCMLLTASGIIGYTFWTIIAVTASCAELMFIWETFIPYETYMYRHWGGSYSRIPRGAPSLERYLRRRYCTAAVLLLPLMLGSLSILRDDLWELTNHLGLIANLILYAVFGAIFWATPSAVSYFDKKWRSVFAILDIWREYRPGS
jgi:hypothetical protein